MEQELTPDDWALLKKLAPECDDLVCTDKGFVERSVLALVAGRFAFDEDDFRERLSTLSDDDLRRLGLRVIDGEEDLGCIAPAFAEAFIEVIEERAGPTIAEQLRSAYQEGTICTR